MRAMQTGTAASAVNLDKEDRRPQLAPTAVSHQPQVRGSRAHAGMLSSGSKVQHGLQAASRCCQAFTGFQIPHLLL